MDVLVLSFVVLIGGCFLLLLLAKIFPEKLGFILRILASLGIVTLLFSFGLPHVMATGDPNLLILTLGGGIILLIVVNWMIMIWTKEMRHRKAQIKKLKQEKKWAKEDK